MYCIAILEAHLILLSGSFFLKHTLIVMGEPLTLNTTRECFYVFLGQQMSNGFVDSYLNNIKCMLYITLKI